MKRDLLDISQLSVDEAWGLLELSARLKRERREGNSHRWLEGATLAMIFEKPSLRTRVTFETGMFQLGGHAVYLTPGDIQLGEREPVSDVAANLSRWVDCIMARTFTHVSIESLAANSTVPVINALSDLFHPCQVLADCFTLSELREDLSRLRIVFVGDGNNMSHSWMNAAALLGLDFTLVCPPGYEGDSGVLSRARACGKGRIEVTNDLAQGTRGADVIYTDVWTSMGQEDEAEKRRRAFAPYQVTRKTMDNAAPGALFMHCLPAHRGEEVSAEVIDGSNSIVLEQSENRLHLQKAVIAWLLQAEEARF